MKSKCVDCGLNEVPKEQELCDECFENNNTDTVIYKIPWQKYDPENPPELEEGKTYFVSDGVRADIGWHAQYFQDEPPRWYVPDRSDIYEPDITHFAVINLPGEE